MATVEVQVEQWQERGIQVMVLLSFAMQLVLLILAEFRRRKDSGMLRAVIWTAYMLADSTAIYILGHLSLTSRSGDHQLMAFWAPFLLVHLGGQDNITAYAIEDNRLWLRHLQSLTVQVAAAAYVLYESVIVGTQALLQKAAAIMFMVGIVKYGERVWALKRAGTSASDKNYRSFEKTALISTEPYTNRRDTECLLRIAHLLLNIPKDLLQGPLPIVMYRHDDAISVDELYKVVQMQLSLMHDVLYSKAEVIHTWYGLCIRVISPVFTAIALVLFHLSDLSAGDHYSRADVVITYVLLGGAVMLEMVSVLRAMFSRWQNVIRTDLSGGLKHVVPAGDGLRKGDVLRKRKYIWRLLDRAIASIRLFILPKRDESRWWWSDSMGQHNLIDMCVLSKVSRRSRIAGWMGVEDWWNTMVYSSFVCVSATIIKEVVVEQVLGTSHRRTDAQSYSRWRDAHFYSKINEEEPDHIINSRGRAALKKWGLYERLGRFLDKELDESILAWHIATDIYLRKHRDQGQAAADQMHRLVEATEAISNYMLFLLATRPYMLAGSVSHTRYVELCYCLTSLKCSRAQHLASLLTSRAELLKHLEEIKERPSIGDNKTMVLARELARELVSHDSVPSAAMLKMLSEVWAEVLCYAGYRCSGYSHAKQLSNGGEFLTIAALLVEYFRRNILKPIWTKEPSPSISLYEQGNICEPSETSILDV
ncbi:hypothetical protein VPH35_033340 [Triticum aestivum]